MKSVAFNLLMIVICLASVVLAEDNSNTPAPMGMEVYKARRQILLDSLGEGAAMLYADGEQGEAGFRSGADFWYLTGMNESGAVLILAPKEFDREILLLPPRDMDAERWTGMRPSLSDSLTEAWGFDVIRRTSSVNGYLMGAVKQHPTLHMISRPASPSSPVPKDLELYRKITARMPGVSIENSSRFLEQMRMVKSDAEIAAIEKAIAITYQGISELLVGVEPGVKEFQLDGILEASFKRQGAQFMAFPPIVGSGEESTILHYETKNKTVMTGELLLLDVGAEWDRYAADISRTFPINGTFTEEQARIYDIVLAAQHAAIEAVKPGVTIREVHEIARKVVKEAGYVDAFLHGTSHHLGIDVHDYANIATPLAPGMVITIEPGIYLPDQEIGIRIEDDVLVTEKGSRVLSADIPRERKEVEAWITAAIAKH